MKRKVIKGIGIITVFALLAIFIFLLVTSLPASTPSEFKELSGEVAYKEISRNMTGDTLFIAYYYNGYPVYICEAQFETLQVPQRIAEGLYLLPNGTYVR